ncbi:hypothetical protein D9757_002624 [Collybiopsis confluens]|uniref:Uncharacterized protein n=1 Tax=Collybiopsis confluens TaxID=2823264 RepID=A0A8H5HW07_9AGAR|nr:hypothetical protein D9757_002624 [Collybiopsis confluens]
MAEEDDIDVDALQAQIDLAMSVTNDLVSSWIKPSVKSNSSYNQNLEAELKEYMRRPPRLGVGAPIPEFASISSRETARLKGQLVGKGKKRIRDEGEGPAKQASDDERESRAGAIRKKPVPNPFTIPATKKKKVGGKSIPLSTSATEDQREAPAAAPLQNGPPNTASAALQQPQSHHRDRESSMDLVNSVLNLNGPVAENGSDSDDDNEDGAAASPSKPKKKRKRRKRKKALSDGKPVDVS